VNVVVKGAGASNPPVGYLPEVNPPSNFWACGGVHIEEDLPPEGRAVEQRRPRSWLMVDEALRLLRGMFA
jgi:hypothetical protein